MRYWLIRVDSQSVGIDANFRSFTLYTRRRPSLSIGDRVLFLEGDPSVFGHSANVESIDPPIEQERRTGSAASFSAKPTTYVLSDVKKLDDPLSLVEARFSLTIVRNTAKPWVHFRRGYRLLPPIDYESLLRRETFVARTGYFELLNSLPTSLELSYRSEQALLPEPTSYLERLQRLHGFVDGHVFEAGRLLRSIEEAVLSLQLTSRDGLAVSHVFASDSEDTSPRARRSDELETQVRRFGPLQKLLESQSETANRAPQDSIEVIIQELIDSGPNQSEGRFERAFRRLR